MAGAGSVSERNADPHAIACQAARCPLLAGGGSGLLDAAVNHERAIGYQPSPLCPIHLVVLNHHGPLRRVLDTLTARGAQRRCHDVHMEPGAGVWGR